MATACPSKGGLISGRPGLTIARGPTNASLMEPGLARRPRPRLNMCTVRGHGSNPRTWSPSARDRCFGRGLAA
eukprot:9659209-Alexandrium_andersonii.AAC.1